MRACYHPEFGEEFHEIEIPTLNAFNKIENGKQETINFSQSDFLNWLYDFNEQYNPEMPAFEILNNIINRRNEYRKKAICPMAFVDIEAGTLIDLEDACNNYHVLPYEGGLFDQPFILLEIFNIIREAKDKYKNVKAEKLLNDSKSKAHSSMGKRK